MLSVNNSFLVNFPTKPSNPRSPQPQIRLIAFKNLKKKRGFWVFYAPALGFVLKIHDFRFILSSLFSVFDVNLFKKMIKVTFFRIRKQSKINLKAFLSVIWGIKLLLRIVCNYVVRIAFPTFTTLHRTLSDHNKVEFTIIFFFHKTL